MKKNDILIITGTALYSYLFYAQSAGINFILFTICLIIFLLVKDRSLIKNTAWIFTAFGSLFTGLAILLYGTSLSVIANILSLCLVASFSINKGSSLLFAALYSLYSYISAIPFIVINAIERRIKNTSSQKTSNVSRILIIAIPLLVTMLFFFIYRAANPVFKNFTENINFDFITMAWIRFTLLGFILTYAFFNHRNIYYLFNKDLKASDKLEKENLSGNESNFFGKPLTISNENLSGIILLGLLNLLLLSVNILDINFLWITKQIPEGLTYSEFVHQGIGLLIISIIIAIGIILFYFRGGLNFYKNNKTLKALAYFWIIQNALLILTTASRNQLYINEYSLTYKRIGVYVYLLLSLIGIITTLIKILQVKSNWFLFRKNGWAFYAVIIFSCYINWDMLITRFNIEHSRELDKGYLLSLSSTPLPDLLNRDHNIASTDHVYKKNLHAKTYAFFQEWKTADWQSWNVENDKIKNRIIELEKENKLIDLNLSSSGVSSLFPISDFKNIQSLNLNVNNFEKLGELSYFRKLQYLDVSSNQIDSLNYFPYLPALKELNISNNQVTDLAFLAKAPALETLTASGNPYLSNFPELNHLKTLDLSTSQFDNYTMNKKYNNLQHLKLNDINKTSLYYLPHFKNLQTLELRSNYISEKDTLIWEKIGGYKTLKNLSLCFNGIKNIKSIPLTTMESLEELDLSMNEISNSSGIELFPNLITLHMNSCVKNNIVPDFSSLSCLNKLSSLSLRHNTISDLSFLTNLANVKILDLSGNKIEKPEVIGKLVNLEELDLSDNSLYEIGSLKNLKKLKKLNLEHNSNITNVAILADLKNLEYLNLGNIPVKDIKIFFHMKNLKYLNAERLNKEQVKKIKTALPQLEINPIPEIEQGVYNDSVAY